MDTILSPPRTVCRRSVPLRWSARAVNNAAGARAAARVRGPTMARPTREDRREHGREGHRGSRAGSHQPGVRSVVANMITYCTIRVVALQRHAAATPFAASAQTLAVFAQAHRVRPRPRARSTSRSLRPSMRGLRAEEVASHPRCRGARGDRAARRLANAHDRRESGNARQGQAGLRADLSGIAKGFGVDQAARALDALGIAITWSRPEARFARATQRRGTFVADCHRAPGRDAATRASRRSAVGPIDGDVGRLPDLLRA